MGVRSTQRRRFRPPRAQRIAQHASRRKAHGTSVLRWRHGRRCAPGRSRARGGRGRRGARDAYGTARRRRRAMRRRRERGRVGGAAGRCARCVRAARAARCARARRGCGRRDAYTRRDGCADEGGARRARRARRTRAVMLAIKFAPSRHDPTFLPLTGFSSQIAAIAGQLSNRAAMRPGRVHSGSSDNALRNCLALDRCPSLRDPRSSKTHVIQMSSSDRDRITFRSHSTVRPRRKHATHAHLRSVSCRRCRARL